MWQVATLLDKHGLGWKALLLKVWSPGQNHQHPLELVEMQSL